MNIKEIAKRGGVSAATVSRVLNNTDPQKVSDRTRKRIMKLCRKHHYHPNAIARGLVTRRTWNIAFACDHLESLKNRYLSGILGGVGNTLEDHNYYLQLAVSRTSDDKRHHLPHYLRIIEEHRVDGIIIYGEEARENDIQYLYEKKFPVVLANFFLEQTNIPAVLPDNISGGVQAGALFTKRNFDSYVFLAGSLAYQNDSDKFSGFKKALADKNISRKKITVHECHYSLTESYEISKKILNRLKFPAAVFAADDEMALGVIQAARELSISIPDKLSVIGFNDVQNINYMSPALTSVTVPVEKIGFTASELLLDIINNGYNDGYSDTINKIPVKLTERETT